VVAAETVLGDDPQEDRAVVADAVAVPVVAAAAAAAAAHAAAVAARKLPI
jgi:hypothetical protein